MFSNKYKDFVVTDFIYHRINYMIIKNKLKKFLLLITLLLLVIPIVNVNANTNVAESIGNTEATIKGSNYEIITDGEQKIILSSGAKVELTGDANNYKIVVEENAQDVSIILNNYNAEDTSGWNSANMIELKDGSSVTLTLIGKNTLCAGPESSAIRVPKNTSLVIDGDGTLYAKIENGSSGATSAVIGSSYNDPFGNITINSGNIYTSFSGGGEPTGIGAGVWHNELEMSGTITLNGGNIHTDVLGSKTDGDKVVLNGNGSAVVYTDKVLLNDDEFNGIIFNSDGSEGTVKGDATLGQNLDIPEDTVLTVPEDASLNIPPNVTLTNNGNIINNGTIKNTGNLQNKGELESNGTITSSTEIDNVIGNEVEPILYNVNIEVGDGGAISPNENFEIKHGESTTFSILPNNGYKIKSIIVNDIDKTNEVVDGKLTISNITEDITITVEFEELADTSKETIIDTYYDVNIKVGNGGAISPNQYFKVKHGESTTFNILPNDGYKIKNIIVNGIDKTNEVIDGKLTISNIIKDLFITVEFEELVDTSKETVIDTYYDVNIKVGNGGITNPGQSFKVKHGESTTLDVLPNNGYKIKNIIVNGIDKTNEVVDGKLTLSNIIEDLLITVEFEELVDSSKENVVDNVKSIETYDNILFYVVLELASIIVITLIIYFKKYIHNKSK